MNTYYLIVRKFDELKCVPHINAELEIVFVQRGKLNIYYDDMVYQLSTGEATLIMPYHLHGFESIEDACALVCMFSYSIATEFLEKYATSEIRGNKFKIKSDTLAYVLPRLDRARHSSDVFEIKSVFYPLISDFIGCEFPISTHIGKSRTVNHVLNYFEQHHNEDITLSKIATATGVNTSSLSKIFKEHMGITFHEFVNNVHFEKSRVLLEKSDMTIAEIAYQCGFGSVRNFNRIFFNNMKCTPTEYRKRQIAVPYQKITENEEIEV